MIVLRTGRDLDRLDALRGGPLVFVPTMGALHEGHLELARRAKVLGPTVVSSPLVSAGVPMPEMSTQS